MLVRFSPGFAGLILAVASNLTAAPVPAGDPATAFRPTLTVRLAPPDQILADIRYSAELIARFAPTQQEGKEFVAATDTAVEHALGPDWRKAVDANRPLFGYGMLDASLPASTAVVLIPVKDRPAFEAMLKRLVGKVETGADGILRVEIPGARAPSGAAINGYLRFAHQYAYITLMNPAVLGRSRIPTPDQIVPGDPEAAASIRVFLDRMPEQYRQQAIASVQQFKALLAGNAGIGSASIGVLGTEMFVFGAPIFQLYSLAEPALRDGQLLTMDLRFDRKRLNLTVEASLTAKAASELSRLTGALKPMTSLFPQMLAADLAGRGIVRGTIPEDVRRVFIAVLETGAARLPAADPIWGSFGAKLDESLIPTIRAGEIDLAAGLIGPTKNRYGVVAAARLADAAGVEKAFRDAVKVLPKADQALFKLDAATVGGVKVHQIQPPPLPEPAKSLFGESTVHIAFRPDGVVAAFGEGALESLASGLNAKPQPLPQTFIDVSGRKLVPIVTKIDADIAKKFKAFLGNDLDRIPILEIAVEGGPALRVRYGNVLTSLVPFMSLYAFRPEMHHVAPPAAKPASPR